MEIRARSLSPALDFFLVANLTSLLLRNYIVAMKTRIVKIGNSQGVRIPKLFLEQTRLGEEVELEVRDDQIIIRPATRPRQGWDESFQLMSQKGDDQLLIEGVSLSGWDKDEWQW